MRSLASTTALVCALACVVASADSIDDIEALWAKGPSKARALQTLSNARPSLHGERAACSLLKGLAHPDPEVREEVRRLVNSAAVGQGAERWPRFARELREVGKNPVARDQAIVTAFAFHPPSVSVPLAVELLKDPFVLAKSKELVAGRLREVVERHSGYQEARDVIAGFEKSPSPTLRANAYLLRSNRSRNRDPLVLQALTRMLAAGSLDPGLTDEVLTAVSGRIYEGASVRDLLKAYENPANREKRSRIEAVIERSLSHDFLAVPPEQENVLREELQRFSRSSTRERRVQSLAERAFWKIAKSPTSRYSDQWLIPEPDPAGLRQRLLEDAKNLPRDEYVEGALSLLDHPNASLRSQAQKWLEQDLRVASASRVPLTQSQRARLRKYRLNRNSSPFLDFLYSSPSQRMGLLDFDAGGSHLPEMVRAFTSEPVPVPPTEGWKQIEERIWELALSPGANNEALYLLAKWTRANPNTDKEYALRRRLGSLLFSRSEFEPALTALENMRPGGDGVHLPLARAYAVRKEDDPVRKRIGELLVTTNLFPAQTPLEPLSVKDAQELSEDYSQPAFVRSAAKTALAAKKVEPRPEPHTDLWATCKRGFARLRRLPLTTAIAASGTIVLPPIIAGGRAYLRERGATQQAHASNWQSIGTAPTMLGAHPDPTDAEWIAAGTAKRQRDGGLDLMFQARRSMGSKVFDEKARALGLPGHLFDQKKEKENQAALQAFSKKYSPSVLDFDRDVEQLDKFLGEIGKWYYERTKENGVRRGKLPGALTDAEGRANFTGIPELLVQAVANPEVGHLAPKPWTDETTPEERNAELALAIRQYGSISDSDVIALQAFDGLNEDLSGVLQRHGVESWEQLRGKGSYTEAERAALDEMLFKAANYQFERAKENASRLMNPPGPYVSQYGYPIAEPLRNSQDMAKLFVARPYRLVPRDIGKYTDRAELEKEIRKELETRQDGLRNLLGTDTRTQGALLARLKQEGLALDFSSSLKAIDTFSALDAPAKTKALQIANEMNTQAILADTQLAGTKVSDAVATTIGKQSADATVDLWNKFRIIPPADYTPDAPSRFLPPNFAPQPSEYLEPATKSRHLNAIVKRLADHGSTVAFDQDKPDLGLRKQENGSYQLTLRKDATLLELVAGLRRLEPSPDGPLDVHNWMEAYGTILQTAAEQKLELPEELRLRAYRAIVEMERAANWKRDAGPGEDQQ